MIYEYSVKAAERVKVYQKNNILLSFNITL